MLTYKVKKYIQVEETLQDFIVQERKAGDWPRDQRNSTRKGYNIFVIDKMTEEKGGKAINIAEIIALLPQNAHNE